MLTLAQKFSSAMNGIDDEFIEEALTYERSKKRKPSCVLRIVLVAALISVLLFTSALAFSPSLRENTLNVLVEIFSDHATFCVEGEEPAGSYIAGKIDYSALEETYRLDPGGCYRADFASGATFFGNNGEIISITVVAIRDGLVGGLKLLTMQSQSPSRFTVRMLRFTGVRTRNAREKPVQRPTSFRLMKKTVGSSTFGALSSRRTSLSPLQNRSKSHSPLTLRAMSKSLHSMLSMQ